MNGFVPRNGEVAADGKLESPECFDDQIKPLSRSGDSKIIDLALYRWRGPRPDPREERDLIRQAQRGDERAWLKLVEASHYLVIAIANEYSGPSWNDRVAAGLLGLSEAVHNFNFRQKNGLSTYAPFWIRKHLGELVKGCCRGGAAGETRADRFVWDHPNATAEDVARAVKCSLPLATKAIERLEIYKAGLAYYATTETNCDDEDSPRIAGVRDCDVYSKYQLSPHLRRGECVSRLTDELAIEANLRAMRRLAKIGRRQYALELAVKEYTSIEPLFDVTQKTYGIPVNTHDTAECPVDQKEPLAPAAPPLVWDEKRNGIWQRVGRLPDEEARSAERRMLKLVAVNDGEEDARQDDAIRGGRALHHTNRGNRRGNRQASRAAG